MMDNNKQTIWKFIRGDLATNDFESWAYKNKELEEVMGGEIFLEKVSTDYQSKSKTNELKQKHEKKIRKWNCQSSEKY
jgi:hypothetical protein